MKYTIFFPAWIVLSIVMKNKHREKEEEKIS